MKNAWLLSLIRLLDTYGGLMLGPRLRRFNWCRRSGTQAFRYGFRVRREIWTNSVRSLALGHRVRFSPRTAPGKLSTWTFLVLDAIRSRFGGSISSAHLVNNSACGGEDVGPDSETMVTSKVRGPPGKIITLFP